MRKYTEQEVCDILQHVENKGFNEDCHTWRQELNYLEEIGIIKKLNIPVVIESVCFKAKHEIMQLNDKYKYCPDCGEKL